MIQLRPAAISHIAVDERGVARLAATPRYKVSHIIVERTALGMTPEEIVAAHPDVLTLAQVHAALAYYYDNKAAMDGEIAKSEAEAERRWRENQDSPVRQKLRSLGRLP